MGARFVLEYLHSIGTLFSFSRTKFIQILFFDFQPKFFQLVQYMTTTFSPFEVKVRKELVAYQIALGVIVCILMGVLVLMGVFAYLYCDRSEKYRSRRIRRMRNMDDAGKDSSAEMTQMSCL